MEDCAEYDVLVSAPVSGSEAREVDVDEVAVSEADLLWWKRQTICQAALSSEEPEGHVRQQETDLAETEVPEVLYSYFDRLAHIDEHLADIRYLRARGGLALVACSEWVRILPKFQAFRAAEASAAQSPAK